MVRRIMIINKIVETMKKMKETGNGVKDLNRNEMMWAIVEEYGCTERKAKEYMKVGLIKFERIGHD